MVDFVCKNCGEQMSGDGYRQHIICPNVADDVALVHELDEPDADPVYCDIE